MARSGNNGQDPGGGGRLLGNFVDTVQPPSPDLRPGVQLTVQVDFPELRRGLLPALFPQVADGGLPLGLSGGRGSGRNLLGPLKIEAGLGELLLFHPTTALEEERFPFPGRRRDFFQQVIGRRQGFIPFLPLEIGAGDFPKGLFGPQALWEKIQEPLVLGDGPVGVAILEEIVSRAHLCFFIDDPLPLFLRPSPSGQEEKKGHQEDHAGHGSLPQRFSLKPLCPSETLPGSPGRLWEEIGEEYDRSKSSPEWTGRSGAPPGGPHWPPAHRLP